MWDSRGGRGGFFFFALQLSFGSCTLLMQGGFSSTDQEWSWEMLPVDAISPARIHAGCGGGKKGGKKKPY